MFCNQCEQTAKGTGCTAFGVCGKSPEIAAIQDLINYSLRGLAVVALEAEKKGVSRLESGRLVARGLFSTITNVNFDREPLLRLLKDIVAERDKLAAEAGLEKTLPVTKFELGDVDSMDADALVAFAAPAMITHFTDNEDTNSLAQIVLFGLKGVAAYTDHAAILGQESPAHYRSMYEAVAFGFDGKTPTLDEWVAKALEVGGVSIESMALLDAGNTGTYGHPEPTSVSLKPRPGKAIVVTGHDLKDLHNLLLQTEGKGINIYTHGEMLPTHGYPELKKFPHFAGHFGTAWQNQQKELPHFPGPVLFTTNCIQKPAVTYMDNVFTTGLVGWPGAVHVKNGDFGPVIERALAAPGFSEEDIAAYPDKSVMVGFARNAVLGVADKVVDAVKSGAIRHFFLVAGCDGAKPGRNYYTEFVEKTPADSIVLTLACGKFRFFDKQLGDIGGIPRLLDVGQCNDAYSAVKIAQALAEAFQCGVNDLPLSFVLSWYEQKAVAVLLALLHLGVQNIHLGPSLPAFISPAVLQVLVDNFNITPIKTPDEDLQALLA